MRTVVLLIPYSIKSGKLFVMMQQRSMQQKRIPGYISFFGGGMNEGESEEQALTREVKEELNFDLKINQVKLFQSYEFYKTINHAYLFETNTDWTPPAVLEGDAAVWLNVEDAFDKPNITLKDKTLLNDLEIEFLNKPIR